MKAVISSKSINGSIALRLCPGSEGLGVTSTSHCQSITDCRKKLCYTHRFKHANSFSFDDKVYVLNTYMVLYLQVHTNVVKRIEYACLYLNSKTTELILKNILILESYHLLTKVTNKIENHSYLLELLLKILIATAFYGATMTKLVSSIQLLNIFLNIFFAKKKQRVII